MKTTLRSDQLTAAGLLLAVPVVFFISILNYEMRMNRPSMEERKERSEPPGAQSYSAEATIPGQFLISQMLFKI